LPRRFQTVRPHELTIASLPARIEADGNPWLEVNANPQALEPLLAMHERDLANELMDAPWPPRLSETTRRASSSLRQCAKKLLTGKARVRYLKILNPWRLEP
jgi:hypothetical protein